MTFATVLALADDLSQVCATPRWPPRMPFVHTWSCVLHFTHPCTRVRVPFFSQTDASNVTIIHNHYISAIAYEPVEKSLPNTNAYRLDAEGMQLPFWFYGDASSALPAF